jgi:hypothetical protein
MMLRPTTTQGYKPILSERSPPVDSWCRFIFGGIYGACLSKAQTPAFYLLPAAPNASSRCSSRWASEFSHDTLERGGLPALIHALTVMEICLLPLLYYLIKDANIMLQRAKAYETTELHCAETSFDCRKRNYLTGLRGFDQSLDPFFGTVEYRPWGCTVPKS